MKLPWRRQSMPMPNMRNDTGRTSSELSIQALTSTCRLLDNNEITCQFPFCGCLKVARDDDITGTAPGPLDFAKSPMQDTSQVDSIRYRVEIQATRRDGSTELAYGGWDQVASWSEIRGQGGSCDIFFATRAMAMDMRLYAKGRKNRSHSPQSAL